MKRRLISTTATWRYIPKDSYLHTLRRENLKSRQQERRRSLENASGMFVFILTGLRFYAAKRRQNVCFWISYLIVNDCR
jgi:hypothetical protein